MAPMSPLNTPTFFFVYTSIVYEQTCFNIASIFEHQLLISSQLTFGPIIYPLPFYLTSSAVRRDIQLPMTKDPQLLESISWLDYKPSTASPDNIQHKYSQQNTLASRVHIQHFFLNARCSSLYLTCKLDS
jgi:hypothetical protein